MQHLFFYAPPAAACDRLAVKLIMSKEGGDVRDGAALVATMRTITFAGIPGFVQLNADGGRYNDGEVRNPPSHPQWPGGNASIP